MNKNELRKYILEKRDQLDPLERSRWDSIIFDKFIERPYYKSSKVIFIFMSFRSEVDTHNIIKRALLDGKIVGVPRVISKTEGMKVFEITSMEDMEKGYFGLLEPNANCPEIKKEKIDLIVMPGAAFDKDGGRIGYGGGFYDRYLSELKRDVKKIALAYSIQMVEQVPMADYDMKVDEIITN